jgi:arylsulfatase A-like enzyme
VVVTSDHGESFGPDLPGDHNPIGHGTSLYPEQTRVPLAVISPDGVGAGRIIDAPVSLKAIPATVARLLGIETSFRGALPLESDWPADDDPALLLTLRYSTYHEDALVTSRWFYRRDVAQNREELYDLEVDAQARVDLARSGGELASFRERCDRLLAGESGSG